MSGDFNFDYLFGWFIMKMDENRKSGKEEITKKMNEKKKEK